MAEETLEGTVERITFYNDENGYTVARVRPSRPHFGRADKDALYTVVGNLPELQPGESVRFGGRWSAHRDYGKQFEAASVEQMAPATLEGLRRYLGSGLIKGVGPVTAKKIVEHFGLSTMDILESDATRMVEAPGVGKHRAGLIAEGWAKQRAVKDVMVFLASHKVSTGLAVKIYKQYGDTAIAQVQADPYRLARDITGIGFKSADTIARNMGLPLDAPERISAGIVFTLFTLSEEGHVYAPRSILVETAAALLEVPTEACQAAIDRLARTEEIFVSAVPGEEEGESIEAVYAPSFYHSEIGAARRVLASARAASALKDAKKLDWTALFASLSAESGTTLTAQQQEAVRSALRNKLSVLTGGPGTGKTTTLRAVIDRKSTRLN